MSVCVCVTSAGAMWWGVIASQKGGSFRGPGGSHGATGQHDPAGPHGQTGRQALGKFPRGDNGVGGPERSC